MGREPPVVTGQLRPLDLALQSGRSFMAIIAS
jgi:hypothetical protein